ncbi:MAG TPA: cytochrome c peroxidase [Gemmatimonadales bacterium]|nr:cytochrome c peroxidase [Gemmatimonadales bacterium]
MTRSRLWFLPTLLAAGVACSGDPVATPTDPLDSELRAALAANGVAPLPPPPLQDANQVALGRLLMFDKILSGNKDIACATCHHPLTHSSDGLSLAVGTLGTGPVGSRQPASGRPFIPRNSPDLFNRGYHQFTRMFWDGRVEAVSGTLQTPAGAALLPGLSGPLAGQAMFPVLSRDEMRGQPGDTMPDGQPNELAAVGDSDFTGGWAALTARLMAIPSYVQKFQAAYPGVAVASFDFHHAANAIAAFESEAFVANQTAFDRYLAGDNSALSDSAKRGALVFYGRGRCGKCHSGGLMSNQNFENIAIPQLGPGKQADGLDHGRSGVTAVANEDFAFKAPPLRNVVLTGPWMHNGAYATLAAAIRHYSNPRLMLSEYDPTQLPGLLEPTVKNDPTTQAALVATIDTRVDTTINLTNAEVARIEAFFEALTDPASVDMSALVPDSVPSGLPVN